VDGFPGEGAARPSDGDDREVGGGSRGPRSGRSAGSLRASALWDLWEGPFSGYAAPMSENGLTAAQRKMRDADVAEQAIDVFSHYYRALEDGATGLSGGGGGQQQERGAQQMSGAEGGPFGVRSQGVTSGV